MLDALIVFVSIVGAALVWWLIGMLTTIPIDIVVGLEAWWRGTDDIRIDLSDEDRHKAALLGPILTGLAIIVGICLGIGLLWRMVWRAAKLPTSLPSMPSPVLTIKARKRKTKPYVPTYRLDPPPGNNENPA